MNRCYVVGTGSLAICSIRILQSSGFRVLGVHSTDGSLCEEAALHSVEHFNERSTLEASMRQCSFEWLFSLNNPWIIPSHVLCLPRILAVNYHDSPLPRYRGMHATSWALLHGESRHAVTFHEVAPEIDTGRILRQVAIDIAPDDTAWSLNAKCFEVAIETFRDLAVDLSTKCSRDDIVGREQDGAQGSYFGKWQRPPQAAIIDFAQCSAAICNLVRALDFGPIENPLGLPKIWLGNRMLAVRHATPVMSGRTEAVGTIVDCSESHLDVMTATGVVRLSGITMLDGQSVDLGSLVSQLGGDRRLCPLDTVLARQIDESIALTCRHEHAWVRRLATLQQPEFPFRLSESVVEGDRCILREFSRELLEPLTSSLFESVIGCFAAILAKVNGGNPFDIGVAVPQGERLLGAIFAEIVPVRLETKADASLEQCMGGVGEALRTTATMLTYSRDTVTRYPELRDAERQRFRLAIVTDGVDVPASVAQLCVDVDPNSKQVSVVHRGALAPWQSQLLDEALAQVVKAARETPCISLNRVPWMSRATKQRVLYEWNDTVRSLEWHSIPELIAMRACERSDVIAVHSGNEQLTYGELVQRVDELARCLVELGVQRGDVVAVSLPRGVAIVVAMLGIVRAGGAYLPIDPEYPGSRVAYMLANAQAGFAVSEPQLAKRYFGSVPSTLLMDGRGILTARPDQSQPNGTRPLPTIDSKSLFCVIYTSGSTGNPKGVEVTHLGMLNHGLAIAGKYGLDRGDRVLCSAAIGFDVLGEQIYPALVSGAEVVMRPSDLFDSFRRFESFVDEARITTMILPTAFWHEWTDDLAAANRLPPAALRVLSVGTEKAQGTCLAKWQRVSRARVAFFQGYGPTETTITSTMYQHDGALQVEEELPIGRPLPNTQVYLLDDSLEPVPPGVIGEIYIAGLGVARGYRNDPERTATRFIECPFLTGTWMYRTGDLARFDEHGQLVFVGRKDSQIKIRGYRVELGEIENAFRTHPKVADVVVLLRAEHGDPELIAYVIDKDGGAGQDKLLDFVRRSIPAYMVPRAIVRMDRFPITPNQKIDRRALPQPPRSVRALTPDRAPQSGGVRASIARIWTEILGLVPGPQDDFFSLGGNSLLAVRMLSMVERDTSKLVPLSRFIQNPTIEGLLVGLGGDILEPYTVVSINGGDGLRPPLWLVHAVGGHVGFGFKLRRYMAPDQPIFGLQADGLDGHTAPLCNVRAMAQTYMERLRKVQNVGPYFVGGPSMGGLIAIEIARLLAQQGEHVALLALLDVWGPNYPRPVSAVRRLLDQVRTVREQSSWSGRLALFQNRLLNSINALRLSGARTVRPHYDVLDGLTASAEQRDAIQRVIEASERANMEHVVSPYNGAVLLLRATATRWSGMRFDDTYNGWSGLITGQFETKSFDCTHSQLSDNPPRQVAEALQSAIDSAWEACRSMSGIFSRDSSSEPRCDAAQDTSAG